MKQTNWVVLTGVTCSGKTSLIKLFAKNGFKSKEEIARIYIAEMLNKGISPNTLKKNRKVYFEKLFDLQVDYENSILPFSNEIHVLDRAIPDILAYSIVDNFDNREVMKSINMMHRYRKIFVLDPLPFVDDGFRSLDISRRSKLNLTFEEVYKELSYCAIRVPAIDIEERFNFILKQL